MENYVVNKNDVYISKMWEISGKISSGGKARIEN